MHNINELEIVQTADLYIFANVWKTNDIIMIDSFSGHVVHTFDMTELYNIQKQFIKDKKELFYDWNDNVLNGIAYYPPNDSFLVTGKLWDFIFEVKLDYQ